MPLTSKGEEILANMKKEYGSKKGESVLYASKNAGKITGIDAAPQASSAAWGKCFAHDCWKTMGKDSSMGSDPSSSIPAASEEEDQAGMIAGRDGRSVRGRDAWSDASRAAALEARQQSAGGVAPTPHAAGTA